MTKRVKINGLTGKTVEAISKAAYPKLRAEIFKHSDFISTVKDGVPGREYEDGTFIPNTEKVIAAE